MRKFAGIVAGVVAVAAMIGLSGHASAAGPDLVITGPGAGSPNIRTFAADGTVGKSFLSKGENGATVASGDVNGDGKPDIITGTGPGVEATVQVWSADGATLIAQATPFPGFEGGMSVAAANEDTTAQLEVIVAAGPGGGPHVKVLRFSNGQLVDEFGFMAYDPNFHGGVFVAGSAGRIITGAGAGGGPHVKVFRIDTNGQLSTPAQWMAYDPKFTGGVHVAAGAVRTSTDVDVVTGAGAGGGPHVKLFSLDGAEGPGVMAYDPKFAGGVWVAVAEGQKLITGAGAGGGPHVKVMTVSGTAFNTSGQWMAYTPSFTGGVHVGGFPAGTTSSTTTTAGGGGSTTSTTECTGVPPLCLPGGGGGETTTTTAGGGSTTTTAAPTTTTTAAPTTTTTAAPTTTTTAAPTTTTTTAGGTTTTAPCAITPPLC
jgi:hypothetical protein